MNAVGVLTRKAIADVTRRKGRTSLMILGILIAVMGLTAVNQANDLIGAAFLYSANPASVPTISFSVNRLPLSVTTILQHLPNVETFQLSTQLLTYWHVPAQTKPATLQINGYQDVFQRPLGTFQLTSGRLPGPGEIVMDVSDRTVSPVAIGDTVMLDAPDGHTLSLRIVGLARTQGRALLPIKTQGLAYMSTDVLQHLAVSSLSAEQGSGHLPFLGTQIMVQTSNATPASQTYQAMSHVLSAAHITIYDSFFASSSSTVTAQLIVSGLLNVVRILAGIALLLVCLMIVNTVTTLLAEQIRIIGTMKALGGTRLRIMRSYLLSVGIYGVAGTVLGMALGLLLCANVASFVATQTAADLGPFHVSPGVLLSSAATGLLVPLLAALIPLWIGTRITVREAISAYGVQAGGNRQTRAWGHLFSWVPQMVWLGVRGLFRKPGQVALTLLTLTLSIAVFMAVQVTNASIGVTADHQMNFYQSDVEVDAATSDNPLSARQFISSIQSLPNVTRVEAIDEESVTIAARQLSMIGLPADTHVYHPRLVQGRWLTSQEQGTFVLNDYAAERLNLHVGETVMLSAGTKRARWQLVGIVHETNDVAGSSDPAGQVGDAFTTLSTLNLSLRNLPVDATSHWYIQVHDRSHAALQQTVNAIEQRVHSANGADGSVDAPALAPQQGPGVLLVIYSLFDTVAVLVALVGLLGLSHTLSASVLERRLEIGILRSLGATGWRVSMVFWIEGLALTLITWAIGSMIGIPGG
jgi:putative ABC transport system permease protein